MTEKQWVFLRSLAELHGAKFSREYSRSEAAEVIDDLIERPLSERARNYLDEIGNIVRKREGESAREKEMYEHPQSEEDLRDRALPRMV